MQQKYYIIGLPGAFLSPTSKKKKKKKNDQKKLLKFPEMDFSSLISFLSFMRELSDLKKLKKPLCKNVLGNGTF